MTKDWVHGVGHFPVCQILLQIVVRPVITSSPPAWTSSTGMLSTPADFPFFSDCTAASTSLRRMGWSSSVSIWVQFSTVMGCRPVSSKLITIRLRAVPFNITIVQVYAPMSNYDDNETEEFYDQLQNVIDQTPKKDILVVQREWNAKVGKDACGNWQSICGPFSNDDTNERTQTSGVCHL